ncbi:uncharacterized protein LOC142759807 [Rhinoderma darwinii]|uniref:uncharacterized protein LOC142759807 n=1 Tax=Rhinoderma darwinii TaxID=43563 RepID=UPI003F6754E9
MPYMAVPLSEKELLNTTCWDPSKVKDNTKRYTWSKTSVPLPIAGWMEDPWWQVNLTLIPGKALILTQKENGKWVPKNVTKTLTLGEIPIKGIKISFNKTQQTSDVFRPSLVERYIHNGSWEYGHFFPSGSKTDCKRYPGYMEETDLQGNETMYCGCTGVYHGSLGTNCPWCVLQQSFPLVHFAHMLTLGSMQWFDLPHDIYIVCGHNAYKWIPQTTTGTCTLARLQSATWTWDKDALPYDKVPKHMLYKREGKQKAHPLVHLPWHTKLGYALSIFGGPIRNAHNIEKLAELFDNITELIFDALNVSSVLTRQLITVTNQHTLVLDYLTASQGGMCQIVGPACCHYIDPQGTVQIKHDIEQAKQLKEEFRKANSEEDWNLDWPDWLSWLNPASWFRGIGGWAAGLMQGALHILLIILIIYVFVKLVACLIPMLCKKAKKIVYHNPKPFNQQYPMSQGFYAQGQNLVNG